MNEWNAGYVTDIGYTYGNYPELNPLRVELAFLFANLAPSPMRTACELGFGQGLSVNMHAAAAPMAWYGNDFNPSQAVYARHMAEVSGARAVLSDESFEAFCARGDLPEFDFIAMHGIWSWISDANRAIIIDFIGRKLKPGGVLYISYNTQPGWAAMVPVRELLTDHAALMGSPGQGIAQRVDGAMAFAARLMATEPKFATANPQVSQRLADIQTRDRAYLAHEYFNRDWSPMSFAAMAKEMDKAKLSFACSATYIEQLPELNLSPAQIALLDEIGDPVFRESVRDFCMNTQFRRDYWVKGPQKMSALRRSEAMQAHRVQLVQPRARVSLKANAGIGELELKPEAYTPIVDALADYQARSIGELFDMLKPKGVVFSQLCQCVLILCSTGVLASVQDAAAIAVARPACDALNRHLCEQARGSALIQVLASPVTGGGVTAHRFHQLFLLARSRGVRDEKDLAAYAWSQLDALNERINSGGKPLLSAAENLDYLQREAAYFMAHWLPLFDALQVMPVSA